MPFPFILQIWINAHLLFYPCLPNQQTPPNPEKDAQNAKTLATNAD